MSELSGLPMYHAWSILISDTQPRQRLADNTFMWIPTRAGEGGGPRSQADAAQPLATGKRTLTERLSPRTSLDAAVQRQVAPVLETAPRLSVHEDPFAMHMIDKPVQRQGAAAGGATSDPDVARLLNTTLMLQDLASRAEQVARSARLGETSPAVSCIAFAQLLGETWPVLITAAGIKGKVDGFDADLARAQDASRPFDVARAANKRDGLSELAAAIRDAAPLIRRDLHRIDAAARVVVASAKDTKPPVPELGLVLGQFAVVADNARALNWSPMAPEDLRLDTGRGSHASAAELDESIAPEPTAARLEGEYASHGAETVGSERYRVWGFPLGSADVPDSSAAMLDMIADMAAADPLAMVRVAGHTSASGPERLNDNLSEERAYRILEELSNRGIDASRILAVGSGEAAPLLDEQGDPARMARNRRVEITLVGVAGIKGSTEPDDPALSCRDLAMDARFHRVHYAAWNYWWQDGGYGGSTKGVKDRGFDGDSIRPNRFQVMRAAREHGFSSDHDIKAFEEQIVPVTIGTNLDAHMRDLKNSAERLESMAKDPHHCDSKAPLTLKLMTFDDSLGASRKRDRTLNPPANSKAPGGQRY